MRTGRPRPLSSPRGGDLTERLLLRLIHRRQPITRAEISEITALPLSTVAFNTNRLLRSGWIYESDAGISSGGRPARHLHVNGEKMVLLGVDIGVVDTALAAADYNGQIFFRQDFPTHGDPPSFIKKLSQRIRHLVEVDYKGRSIGCLGVSVPALVDTHTGALVRAPNLGWSDIPVRDWFEQYTGLPVLVDNDTNAAALAELWQADFAREGVESLLYILVVEGVGSALVVDGKIYRGSRIGTGGFGHLCIVPGGLKCSCGGRGCLEVYASNRAIMAAYRGSSHSGGRALTVTDIINLARRGQRRAREVLVGAAEKLGMALRGLVHGLAPSTVVVGGEISDAWFLIGPIISDHLKGSFIVPELATIRVLPSVVRNRPSLVGAVTMGIFPEMTHPHDRFAALHLQAIGRGSRTRLSGRGIENVAERPENRRNPGAGIRIRS
jgi:predicted NBD/HSP70 family sugar kinase